MKVCLHIRYWHFQLKTQIQNISKGIQITASVLHWKTMAQENQYWNVYT